MSDAGFVALGGSAFVASSLRCSQPKAAPLTNAEGRCPKTDFFIEVDWAHPRGRPGGGVCHIHWRGGAAAPVAQAEPQTAQLRLRARGSKIKHLQDLGCDRRLLAPTKDAPAGAAGGHHG